MAPSICSERLRVLWIAPRWPFPTDDGAKRASVELLRPLSSRSSLEIDYVGLVARWTEPDLNPEALASIPLSSWRRIGRGSASAWLQKLRGLVKSFLLETSFPYSVQSFRDRALISEIESCFQKKSYDVCVIDGLHAAASLMAANGSQLRGTGPACVASSQRGKRDLEFFGRSRFVPLEIFGSCPISKNAAF